MSTAPGNPQDDGTRPLSPLTLARRAIAEALRGIPGLNVADHAPRTPATPCALITPDEPYLDGTPQAGVTVGRFMVRHVITLVASPGANEPVTVATDAMLCAVIEALDALDGGVLTVSTFYAYDAGSTRYLAVDIRTQSTLEI